MQSKILIAPDKFKGTLSAREAASAIERGIRRVRPELPASATVLCPLADGGDGTASIVVEATAGYLIGVGTEDPLGRPITASIGVAEWNGSKTALIESAAASGLALLGPDEVDPVRASTFGTGGMIRASIAREMSGLEDIGAIVVFVGGTATTDAGLGALSALGVGLYDQDGKPLGPHDGILLETRHIDTGTLTALDGLDQGRFQVATDVTNPMTGPRGAVAAFGPQKGIAPRDIPLFEDAMRRICRLYEETFGIDVSAFPRSGAGGGLAGGLSAAFGADLTDGFEFVSRATGLESRLAGADHVITGEGAVDRTTFEGKTIGKVIDLAQRHGVRVTVIAGRIDEETVIPTPPVEACLTLESLASYPKEPMDDARGLLECAASRWAEDFLAAGRM